MQVPEHTDESNCSAGYEVSTKWLPSVALQQICSAVSFSIRTIVPPQCGHNQEAGSLVSRAVDVRRF